MGRNKLVKFDDSAPPKPAATKPRPKKPKPSRPESAKK